MFKQEEKRDAVPKDYEVSVQFLPLPNLLCFFLIKSIAIALYVVVVVDDGGQAELDGTLITNSTLPFPILANV